MAVMTAEGLTLRDSDGKEVVVMPSDRVELVGGQLGTIHCWSQDGVIVMLDQGTRPLYENRDRAFLIAALDCGDGDIVRKL